MTSNIVKADSWQADRLTDVAVVRAGLLDIIDCGADYDDTPAGHVFAGSRGSTCEVCGRDRRAHERGPASRRDQDSTFRHGDPGYDQGERFHYAPTPRKQGRSNEPSDPTGKAAVAREAAIQQAVTDLSAVVSALASGITNMPPPDELETRKVRATYTRPARTVVDADPAMCRIHVVEVCGWLEAVVAEVAGQWRSGWDGDVTLRDRVSRVESLLSGLRRRVAPDRPRMCACGCGRPAPPKGEGATRRACVQARYRARQEGAA